MKEKQQKIKEKKGKVLTRILAAALALFMVASAGYTCIYYLLMNV